MRIRKVFSNKKGTAEIVGTILFLVILFFFFSNVFLWHNQITKEMDQVVANKMNAAVRIETTISGGQPTNCSSETIDLFGYGIKGYYNSTWQKDKIYRIINESSSDGGNSDPFKLKVNYSFNTTIDTDQEKRIIAAVSLSIYANYTDLNYESCSIDIYDVNESAWVPTGLTITKGFKWSNITLSQPNRYLNDTGYVQIRIEDQDRSFDKVQGTLEIDYMEVRCEPIALKITNLGGLDITISRLWIMNNTKTATPEHDHMYIETELLKPSVSVPIGSQKIIMLGNSTEFSEESIAAEWEGGNVIIHYVPPAGQTVIFKIISEYGNTAACSYSFPPD